MQLESSAPRDYAGYGVKLCPWWTSQQSCWCDPVGFQAAPSSLFLTRHDPPCLIPKVCTGPGEVAACRAVPCRGAAGGHRAGCRGGAGGSVTAMLRQKGSPQRWSGSAACSGLGGLGGRACESTRWSCVCWLQRRGGEFLLWTFLQVAFPLVTAVLHHVASDFPSLISLLRLEGR